MHGSWMLSLENGERCVMMNEWFNCLNVHAVRSMCTSLFIVCVSTNFMMSQVHNNEQVVIQFINATLPAPLSQRCTAPGVAHCYCHEFGARVDTSHHVWGMSEVGERKVS